MARAAQAPATGSVRASPSSSSETEWSGRSSTYSWRAWVAWTRKDQSRDFYAQPPARARQSGAWLHAIADLFHSRVSRGAVAFVTAGQDGSPRLGRASQACGGGSVKPLGGMAGGMKALEMGRALTSVDARTRPLWARLVSPFPSKQAKSGSTTEGEGFEPSSEESPPKRFSRPPH